jgi:hypothetical protein
MASVLKLRRGTTATHSTFIGSEAEVTYDTTTKSLVAHDGETAGGFPVIGAHALASGIGATLVGVNAFQTQADINQESFTIEGFGGNGNGVADNSAALLATLTAANGRTITLQSGMVYKLDTAVSYSGNVSIKSSGAKPAIIFHAGQAFTPLTITGALAFSRNLTATQQVHNYGWDLADASGILPGMLVEVKSSASWYHDPRPESTDARKSELHRVAYVDGNTVFMEDAANDGYTLPAETVTLTFYNPVSVNLSNITVRCTLPAVGVDAVNVIGLKIAYAYEPTLWKTSTEGAAAAGIQLAGCYNALVTGGHSHSSNNFYTGYGVQFVGSANCRVTGRKFWRCRRGVDVSGFNIISRHTLIDNNTNHGGGLNSEGTPYGWYDDGTTGAPQFGFGSHGPSDHTIYRGNTVSRMRSFINVRGRNELIEDNNFIGRSVFGGISAGYGENITIRNNKAYFGSSPLKGPIVVEGGGNINTRRCDYFVYFTATYQGGDIVINDNQVEVQEAFVAFQSTVFPTISLLRNKVRFATSSGTTLCYLASAINAVADVGTWTTPLNWVVVDNDYRRVGGSGEVSLLYGVVKDTTWKVVDFMVVTTDSGDWTPTVTPVVNCASASSVRGLWSRTGNRVSFNVSVSVTPIGAGTATFSVSLPIGRSNFSSTTSGGGVIGLLTLYRQGGGAFTAKVGSQELDCRFYCDAVAVTAVQISGSYEL